MRLKLMVDIQVAHSLVSHAAELAGHIAGRAEIPPEHLPDGRPAELRAFFRIGNVCAHIYLSALTVFTNLDSKSKFLR